MAKDKAVPFDFSELMAMSGPFLNQSSNILYRIDPQTAARAAGVPTNFIGPLSKAQLTQGALGVTRAGARRFPLLAGGLQLIGGDPIGGVGRAAGGFAGAAALGKLGMMTGNPLIATGLAIAGGLMGGDIGQGITRTVTGIDVNNPLTGPDISIPGLDIPLTPYAKTKKSVERAAELEALRMKELLPMLSLIHI